MVLKEKSQAHQSQQASSFGDQDTEQNGSNVVEIL